jgi:hypothetical protein
MPRLVLCASLWSLSGHPRPAREWALPRRLRAIREAGFAAVSGPPAGLTALAAGHGLRRLAAFIAPDWDTARTGLDLCAAERPERVNIQIGTPALTRRAAARLVAQTWAHARSLALAVSFETHRGTALETPDKLRDLARDFAQATGATLPVTWDFSHHAVARQLPAGRWLETCLGERELLLAADMFHLRPHTAHHVQIPVGGRSGPTPEYLRWETFARDLLRVWKTAPGRAGRELFVCPELGPKGDYALASHPAVWPETVELARRLRGHWQQID